MTGPIVCLGEMLIRLAAPGAERLLQSPALTVHLGGAEANVAVSLARLGHPVKMLSVLPDNALGDAALADLRGHGVDVSGVRRGTGRMGLYFLQPGALHLPPEVLYDRADSAFARAPAGTFDWRADLDGADWLHLSGITAALGQTAAAEAERAVTAAAARGIAVAIDCNYRAKLWDAWQGDGPGVMRRLLAQATLMFGDHRDIALLLGGEFASGSTEARLRQAADAAFAAFPRLQRVACTSRTLRGAQHQTLQGWLATRDALHQSRTYDLDGIVDRVGAGDAFAAGLTHGLRQGMGDQDALEFAAAAGCLKHAIPGDRNLVGAAEIEALLAGGGDIKR